MIGADTLYFFSFYCKSKKHWQVLYKNFIKKRLQHRWSSENFAKSLRTPFQQNSSGRLLLESESNNMIKLCSCITFSDFFKKKVFLSISAVLSCLNLKVYMLVIFLLIYYHHLCVIKQLFSLWRPITMKKVSCTQFKKHKCFAVNFAKFLRTHFFYRTPPVAASD